MAAAAAAVAVAATEWTNASIMWKKSKHIDQKIAQAERENTLNLSAKCLVGVAVVVCAVICVNGCCCFCCWCIVHVLRYRVHVVGCVLPHQGR